MNIQYSEYVIIKFCEYVIIQYWEHGIIQYICSVFCLSQTALKLITQYQTIQSNSVGATTLKCSSSLGASQIHNGSQPCVTTHRTHCFFNFTSPSAYSNPNDLPPTQLGIRDHPELRLQGYEILGIQNYQILEIWGYPILGIRDYPILGIGHYPILGIRDYPIFGKRSNSFRGRGAALWTLR